MMMNLQDRPMSQPDPELEGASNSLLRNTRCCFYFPCLGSSSGRSSAVGSAWWQRIRPSGQSQSHHHRDRWWTRAFLKIREWSEIVAGPRWKTFIRRFNRNRSGGDRHAGGQGQFQYDPLSYALNFDEGPVQDVGLFDEDRDYGGFRSFSTRYAAAVPLWNKKTIDGVGAGGSGGVLRPSALDSGGKDVVSLA